MAYAMLGNLDFPSLGSSHGPCYAWDLGCPFIGSFSRPLLCFGVWLAPRWEFLMDFAIFCS